MELKNEICGFGHKYNLLAAENVSVEEVRSVLETKVDSLLQANEGLKIQNESLERDVVDRNRTCSKIMTGCTHHE